jgi:hypothetical protein
METHKYDNPPKTYCCTLCDKPFSTNSGLYKHKKQCEIFHSICSSLVTPANVNNLNRQLNSKNIEIEELKIKNEELKTQLFELQLTISRYETKTVPNKETTNEITVNAESINSPVVSTTETHNHAPIDNHIENNQIDNHVENNQITNHTEHNTPIENFNIHVYLENKCKNAMNIMDLLQNSHFSDEQYYRIGELGYMKGVTRFLQDIFSNHSCFHRPMHHNPPDDSIHIKDENIWKHGNDAHTIWDKIICKIDEKLNLIHKDKTENIRVKRECKMYSKKMKHETVLKNIKPKITYNKRTLKSVL